MTDTPPPPGGAAAPSTPDGTAPPPPGHAAGPDTRPWWVRHSTGLIATTLVVVGIGGSYIYYSITAP
jgi:hypothetical protein